jgi:sigma-B regulation protein RsbQ
MEQAMSPVLQRHNARFGGKAGNKVMMFAHGFGCDQNMWRFVAPAFEERFRTMLFDHAGAGAADPAAYDVQRHSTLQGYADDVIELARAAGIDGGIFVGHSVSAMIGILAAKKAPELFDALVLVGPSPRYVNDGDYFGGFSEQQIEELLDFLDSNHLGWSHAMAPVIMGNAERPELAAELTDSFCRTDPDIAKRFARVTFMSDNRADLDAIKSRVLILQCSDDVIAPTAVGEFVHRAIAGSQLVVLDATGHCPNLSAPEHTIAAIEAFV